MRLQRRWVFSMRQFDSSHLVPFYSMQPLLPVFYIFEHVEVCTHNKPVSLPLIKTAPLMLELTNILPNRQEFWNEFCVQNIYFFIGLIDIHNSYIAVVSTRNDDIFVLLVLQYKLFQFPSKSMIDFVPQSC